MLTKFPSHSSQPHSASLPDHLMLDSSKKQRHGKLYILVGLPLFLQTRNELQSHHVTPRDVDAWPLPVTRSK